MTPDMLRADAGASARHRYRTTIVDGERVMHGLHTDADPVRIRRQAGPRSR